MMYSCKRMFKLLQLLPVRTGHLQKLLKTCIIKSLAKILRIKFERSKIEVKEDRMPQIENTYRSTLITQNRIYFETESPSKKPKLHVEVAS